MKVYVTPVGNPVTTTFPPDPTVKETGTIGLLIHTVWVSVEGLDTRLINGDMEANETSSIPKLLPINEV